MPPPPLHHSFSLSLSLSLSPPLSLSSRVFMQLAMTKGSDRPHAIPIPASVVFLADSYLELFLHYRTRPAALKSLLTRSPPANVTENDGMISCLLCMYVPDRVV